MPKPLWRDAALCMDDPLFMVDRPTPTALALLKRTCAACPVRLACATEALDAKPTWGVWGGQHWTKRGRSL